MYTVTLIHLSEDARSAGADLERIVRPDMSHEGLLRTLENFCTIDPLENARTDPEIRVQVRQESYLLHTANRKLLLYDVHNRNLAGFPMTVPEAIAEIDGTAMTARYTTVLKSSLARPPAPAQEAPPPAAPPAGRLNLPRLIVLACTACALGGALVHLRLPSGTDGPPAAFHRVRSSEAAGLQAALVGVYMTGTKPGEHGMVLTATGELRLFELRGAEPPRVVRATARLGRVGKTLCLATDQPGGLVEITDPGTFVYCGDAYRRIP